MINEIFNFFYNFIFLFRNNQGKIILELENLSSYIDLTYEDSIYTQKKTIIKNLPFLIRVNLPPNSQTNKIDIDVYLFAKWIDQVTVAE